MRRENKSRYAVMGILSLGPMSGYEIRKTIEGSLGNFWSESYGQIYPILKSLLAEGLVTRRTETQEGRPSRHVYALTEVGRENLVEWLGRPVEQDVRRVEILLKLFFGWQVPLQENVRKVESFRALHEGLLARNEGIEQQLVTSRGEHPGLPYWLMTLSYGKHISRALLEWSNETLRTLEALEQAPKDGAEPRQSEEESHG